LNRRGKNTWRAKLFLGRDEHGRKKYLSRTIRRTKKDAESVLNQMLVETGLGGNVVTDATLSDLANRSPPPHTRSTGASWIGSSCHAWARRSCVRRARPRSIPSTARSELAAERRGRPLSATSVQHVHALLRRILNQGVRWG